MKSLAAWTMENTMAPLGNLATLAFFAAVGWLCCRFVKMASRRTFVLLLLAAVIGGSVGVNTQLVSAFGFAVRLNWAIPAFCIGLLLGLLVRRRGLVAPAA